MKINNICTNNIKIFLYYVSSNKKIVTYNKKNYSNYFKVVSNIISYLLII